MTGLCRQCWERDQMSGFLVCRRCYDKNQYDPGDAIAEGKAVRRGEARKAREEEVSRETMVGPEGEDQA